MFVTGKDVTLPEFDYICSATPPLTAKPYDCYQVITSTGRGKWPTGCYSALACQFHKFPLAFMALVQIGKKNGEIEDRSCRFDLPEGGTFMIWEVSRFCNLSCLHCCTDSSPHVDRSQEVPIDKMLAVVDELKPAGVTDLLFSGGEPFLYDGFMDILARVDTSYTAVIIASNGTRLSLEVARRLLELGINRLDISLDGYNSEIHNRMRGHPSAFRRSLEGIRAALEAGLALRVTGMITPDNYERVIDFIELLVSLGVKDAVLSPVMLSAGRAQQNPHIVIDSKMEDIALRGVQDAKRQFGEHIKIDHRLQQPGGLLVKGCLAGKSLLHITPEGEVGGCSYLLKISKERFSLGNIHADSLLQCQARNAEIMRPLTELTPYCPIPHVYSQEPKH